MPALSPDEPRPSEHQWVIDQTMPEQLPGLHHASTRVSDLGVGSYPDTTLDAFAPQVREPVFPNKLAVRAQISDGREPKQAPELIEQRAPLRSVRAALLFQDHPKEREGCALISNAEHENIQGRLSQVPIGAIHCQHPRRGHSEQLEDKGCHARVREFKEAQEALRSLVMRGGLGAASKDTRHLREVDAFNLNQGDKKLRHKVDARFIPRYIAGKRS